MKTPGCQFDDIFIDRTIPGSMGETRDETLLVIVVNLKCWKWHNGGTVEDPNPHVMDHLLGFQTRNGKYPRCSYTSSLNMRVIVSHCNLQRHECFRLTHQIIRYIRDSCDSRMMKHTQRKDGARFAEINVISSMQVNRIGSHLPHCFVVDFSAINGRKWHYLRKFIIKCSCHVSKKWPHVLQKVS